MKTPPAYQLRVLNEKAALDELLFKLNSFLESDGITKIPAPEQVRLARQSSAMLAYSQILGERIQAFE